MEISIGWILGVALLVATIVAMIYIYRSNPDAPRRRDRVIEEE